MAEVDFSVATKTIDKYVMDNDSVVITIDIPRKKLSIQFELKSKFADDSEELHKKHLILRGDDFTAALGTVFPDVALKGFHAGVVSLLKAHKSKLIGE